MKRTKKILLALLCVLCLQLALPLGVLAADAVYMHQWDVQLVDDTIAAELEQTCADAAAKYGCGIYAVILEDFTAYDSTAYEAAKDIYREQNLGVGENRNGILLMLSMSERDYALVCYGDIANSVFTDKVQDKICDAFLDNFAEDDWKNGMIDYVASCAHALEHFEGNVGEAFPGYYKDGVYYPPVDLTWQQVLQQYGWAIVLAAVGIAVFLCRKVVEPALRKSMYTAAIAHSAGCYIPENGVQLSVTEEYYSHTERHIRSCSTYSNSDDFSDDDVQWETTVDSDGFSGRSGKF